MGEGQSYMVMQPTPRPIRLVKYAIPARSPDLLRRARLLDFLHENLHRKLILVAAAAGYGKTSLLADFAHDLDSPVAWCRLDDTDRDLSALVVDVVNALQQAFPAFQSALPSLLAEVRGSPEQLASMLAREIESTLDEYFVLVLDDFHLIEDASPIIPFMDALLANLPEQAHIIVAGRAIPALRLATLAAHQQVAGLSEEHLRFTPAEAQALVELRNHVALPEAEAEKLVANTEGWITGILLTTHLMWQGLMASLTRANQAQGPLYEYLADEVLDYQPEALRRFLLESAVMPEAEPAVCDAVLGRTDSAELLRQAEARRLFISAVGDDARIYQYHHLFRDFLIARLRVEDPARLRELQARAAEWYAANGMVETAVTFYVLAEQLPEAAHVAEANAEAMFNAGRLVTLRRWAEQLAPLAYDAPQLHLSLSVAETDAGGLDAAEAALVLAEEGFARRSDEAGALWVETQHSLLLYRRGKFEQALAVAQAAAERAQVIKRVASEALALRYAGLCQYALGQLASAEESLNRAQQLLQGTSHLYMLAVTLHDLALVLRARGQTARAARAQQQALTIWRQGSAPGPLALALNNIGWDLHMLGQYEAAIATYREALDWARRAASNRTEVMILAGQADVYADLGNREAAAEVYRQALSNAEQVGDWALQTYLCRGMARLDRWAGNFAGALEWLRRAALAAGEGKGESALANLESLRGILLVEMGHRAEGRRALGKVCAEFEKSGALVDFSQALFFRACAEFRDGEQDEAARSLAQAFAAAEQVGYDQMLVSEALLALDMLEALSLRSDVGPRAATLVSRARAAGNAWARAQRAADPSVQPMPDQQVVLKVTALGVGRVLKHGVEISKTEWTSQRIREMFFYLVDRTPVQRDRVLETFWPDKPPGRAVNNLYQILFRLRRTVGESVIVLEEQVCRLSPTAGVEYDVAQFEDSARRALALLPGDLHRLGLLASAVEHYTGDYLADLPVEWALGRRRELSTLYVAALRAYADELMNLTRYGEARAVLARALDVEPLDDELHERMLMCLAGLGSRHLVVDYYMRYRETMRSELGLDPPPEMRALYSRLIE